LIHFYKREFKLRQSLSYWVDTVRSHPAQVMKPVRRKSPVSPAIAPAIKSGQDVEVLEVSTSNSSSSSSSSLSSDQSQDEQVIEVSRKTRGERKTSKDAREVESSAAKKACRENDHDEQNQNNNWEEFVAGMKGKVEKQLVAKRDYFEKLNDSKDEVHNAIVEKEALVQNKEVQISQMSKEGEERMAVLKKEEERLKKLMENFQEEKRSFMNEHHLEYCDATDSLDELEKDIAFLEVQRDQIEIKLETFEEVSLGKYETKKILQRLIREKVKDLECPVCLEEAAPPIFSCTEMHLVCFSCREKVLGNRCPVCRGSYGKKKMRHRFAEKMSENLGSMRKELAGLES